MMTRNGVEAFEICLGAFEKRRKALVGKSRIREVEWLPRDRPAGVGSAPELP
jgi:hypothetical protein